MLSTKSWTLTSNHDAKAPFGIEAPYGHRKRIIQRRKLYLQIQDGHCRSYLQPYSKLVRPMAPSVFVVETIVLHSF